MGRRLSRRPFRFNTALVSLQEMMPNPAVLIGDNGLEIDIFHTFEDVALYEGVGFLRLYTYDTRSI